MIEILCLFFLARSIGRMASERGLNPTSWKIKTVIYWIIAEFIGVFIGISQFGFTIKDIFSVTLFALISGFGGYLLVRYRLEKIDVITPE